MLELRGDRRRPTASRPGPRVRPRGLRLALAALLVGLLAVPAACGTSGRAMQTPIPGATAPPRKADPTTATTVAGQNTVITTDLFVVNSSAFSPGGDVPAEYTCDGAGTSPPISWGNVPTGTVELALVISDPDAGNFVHWIVTHIAPGTAEVAAGAAPAGSVQLANSGGKPGYFALCPPAGETHTYDFTLYALDKASGLTARSDPTQALTTLAVNASATAVLTGSYTRNTAN